MNDITVERAETDDAKWLSTFGARMFAASHADAMLPQDIEAYLSVAFDCERIRRHIGRPDNTFLIARSGSEQIGYARLMTTEASPLVGDDRAIELRRLYVNEEWHGRGAAQALMAAGLDDVRRRGGTACWLHVWERNGRAIRFYEKSGFRTVGREPSPFRESNPIALVMVREIDVLRQT